MSAISSLSTSTTAQTASPSALRRLMSGHPLAAYFAIAYVGTWLVFSPLLLGKDGLGLLPYKIGDAAVLLVFLSAFTGPTLGALSVTAATSGKAGVRRFLRRYIQRRSHLCWRRRARYDSGARPYSAVPGVSDPQISLATVFSWRWTAPSGAVHLQCRSRGRGASLPNAIDLDE